MIRGIHHVAVHVSNLQRMVQFYGDAFGFELVADPFHWKTDHNFDCIINLKDSAGAVALLRSGNCYLEMFEYRQPEPGSTEPKAPNDKGYTHFCVDVVGIEEEMVRLAGLGMTFHQPGPVENMGVVKSIYGKDPEGNIIEIQETLSPGFELDDLTPIAKKR